MQPMTATALLDADATPRVSYFSQDRAVASEERNERGNLVVKGLKVFRIGTFRDSEGRKSNWTAEKLDNMAAHFASLRSAGLFVDVPVRADHSESIHGVVGYIENLYRSGDFLLADFEFTEPEAAGKWERKTFRARSLEVGPYLTNDDQLFYPVATGLAFVDIGAVEHLHRSPSQTKETPTVTTETPTLATFRIKGVSTQDIEAVQGHIDALERAVAKPTELHKFRLATGVETTDYAEVQKQLDAHAETFKQLRESTRSDFVKGLAKDNKIAATAIDDETTFALSLSDEQFATYRKRFENAPAANLFASHGANGSPGGGAPTAPANQPTPVETDKEVIANFRRAGYPEDKLKELASFKRLVAAGQAP